MSPSVHRPKPDLELERNPVLRSSSLQAPRSAEPPTIWRSVVKDVPPRAKSHQCVQIEKIFQGKSASTSATSSLVKLGTSPSTSRTGHPVSESVTMVAIHARLRLKVRTILLPSTRASPASPAHRSSFRGKAAGSTTLAFAGKTSPYGKTILRPPLTGPMRRMGVRPQDRDIWFSKSLLRGSND